MPPIRENPDMHQFTTETLRFGEIRQTVAFCHRCEATFPTGFHWLQPCRPKPGPAFA